MRPSLEFCNWEERLGEETVQQRRYGIHAAGCEERTDLTNWAAELNLEIVKTEFFNFGETFAA
jgi:hypothetical protein